MAIMAAGQAPQRQTTGAVVPLAIGWAVIGLALAGIYSPTDWQANAGLLMISMAFCGALAWLRFAKTRAAVLPDLLSVYLFMQFVSKSITMLGMLVSENREAVGQIGTFMRAYERVPLEYQFDAELVFLIAMLIFSFTWITLERKSVLVVWQAPSPKAIWWTYGVALIAHLLLSITGLGHSAGMTQELMRLFAIGAIAVLLGGHSRYALGQPAGWLPIVALLPLVVLALQSGMKGEFALVLLPILLTIYRRPNPARLGFIGAVIVFAVLFLFPFSHEWREANWFAKENVGIATVATRVAEKWEHDGFLETASESTAQWLSRGSSSAQGGLVMQIAERDGLIGPVLIEGLATIFVPRFLWPDKPAYAPGAWFTWYLGKAPTPEEATTSTAMMLPTELYWMFGWAGVIGGMALLGWLYFACWRFLLVRASRSLIPLVALFALLARSGGLEGIHTIYAVSSPIILVVYVLIYEQLQRFFFPKLSRLGRRQYRLR